MKFSFERNPGWRVVPCIETLVVKSVSDGSTRLAMLQKDEADIALDRQKINEAAYLGCARRRGVIVPRVLEFALQVEPPAHDEKKAKQLPAEAGYASGLDAGDSCRSPASRRWPTAAMEPAAQATQV